MEGHERGHGQGARRPHRCSFDARHFLEALELPQPLVDGLVRRAGGDAEDPRRPSSYASLRLALPVCFDDRLFNGIRVLLALVPRQSHLDDTSIHINAVVAPRPHGLLRVRRGREFHETKTAAPNHVDALDGAELGERRGDRRVRRRLV